MLMSLTPRITPATARRIAAACGTGVLLLGATACGGDDTTTPVDAAAAPQGTTGDGAPGSTDRAGRFPGADGEVAAVDGDTAQVQSRGNGQVAVTWNGSTTFTKQISASAADVRTGSCVMVQPADADEAEGSGDSGDSTTVAAGTVRITEKVDGECAGGMRGGPGALSVQPPQGGEAGAPPQDAPDAPDGARPQVRAFGGTFGEVTAVSADGFTVKATMPRFEEGSQTPTLEETTVTVTVDEDTTFTATGEGSASDVKTGACMRAEGTVDETGAVTAKTIAMSPATDGECGGGMLLRRGDAPSGAGPAGGPDAGSAGTTRES